MAVRDLENMIQFAGIYLPYFQCPSLFVHLFPICLVDWKKCLLFVSNIFFRRLHEQPCHKNVTFYLYYFQKIKCHQMKARSLLGTLLLIGSKNRTRIYICVWALPCYLNANIFSSSNT